MSAVALAAPHPAWISGLRGRQARDAFFLIALVLLNLTLFRPSPVDVGFILALVTTVICRQHLTAGAVFFIMLVLAWYASLFQASFKLIEDEEVSYQMWKIGFATTIGLCACLVAVHWDGTALRRFLRVWIFSATIAATLGIAGFAGGIEDFVWDGRAKGLFDDPNMYAAFLLPALMGCLHLLTTGEGRRWLYGTAFAWLTLGILLSFSRVGIAAFVILAPALLVILNRRALGRTLLYGGFAGLAILSAIACAALFIDGFDDKVLDRFTLAKDYDLGEQGRLNRYVNSVDFILSAPRGLGLLVYERMHPEPIHNIWISSFMNYGWLAGFAWSFLVLFAVVLSLRNYRATRDPIVLTLMLGWLGIFSCALLHEAERWRHLWLMTGLLWGLNAGNWRTDAAALVQRVRPARKRPVSPDAPAPRPA